LFPAEEEQQELVAPQHDYAREQRFCLIPIDDTAPIDRQTQCKQGGHWKRRHRRQEQRPDMHAAAAKQHRNMPERAGSQDHAGEGT